MLLIMCRAGDDRYAIDARHVREVLPQARLQRLGGSPAWLAGLLTCRGTATPVIDLAQLTHGRSCPNRLSSRIILLQTELDGEIRTFGILAEHVGLCETHEETEQDAGRSGGPTALGSIRLDAHGVFQLLAPELLLSADRRGVLFPEAEERR